MPMSVGLSSKSEEVALTIAGNLGQCAKGIPESELRKLQIELVDSKENLSDLDKITLWVINGEFRHREIQAEIDNLREERGY